MKNIAVFQGANQAQIGANFTRVLLCNEHASGHKLNNFLLVRIPKYITLTRILFHNVLFLAPGMEC